MSRFSNLGHRLYQGEVSFDFVGRRKLWYSISGVIVLVAAVGLAMGLKLGIEFKGGSVYTVAKPGLTISQTQDVVDKIVHSHPLVQSVDDGKKIRIQVSSEDQVSSAVFTDKLSKELSVPIAEIDTQVIGPSWGEQISDKALTGLIIFMVLVTVYLAIAFEWRMAVAALVALIHDLLITIGVYALVGFEVTPGTVIGFLTILGYSLYDTVVVFDTVKENAKGLTKQNKITYSEAANAGLNQTLVRSLNTTVVALLPVAALLFIGGGLLGAGDAERHLAGPVHRSRRRCLLLDLRRHPAARAAQGGAAGDEGAGQAGRPAAGRGGQERRRGGARRGPGGRGDRRRRPARRVWSVSAAGRPAPRVPRAVRPPSADARPTVRTLP